MVEVRKIMAKLFRRYYAGSTALMLPPYGRALPTHGSAGKSCTFAKSGSVSCGITVPFSWVLACIRFCLCPSRVCFCSPM